MVVSSTLGTYVSPRTQAGGCLVLCPGSGGDELANSKVIMGDKYRGMRIQSTFD